MLINQRKILAASILIALGIIIGMALSAFYAFEVPGELPRFATPAYFRFMTALAVFVVCGAGLLFCDRAGSRVYVGGQAL